MNKMIKMFYESVRERLLISENEITVMAFNADRGCFTFMGIFSNHRTDYFLMPFTPGLPTQSMPEEYDTIPFTRAFDVYYEKEMNWKQRAFLRFCIEYSHTDTAKNFEEWLLVEERHFIENGKAFLGIDTIPEMLMGYVAESDADLFRKFWAGYKERMGLE